MDIPTTGPSFHQPLHIHHHNPHSTFQVQTQRFPDGSMWFRVYSSCMSWIAAKRMSVETSRGVFNSTERACAVVNSSQWLEIEQVTWFTFVITFARSIDRDEPMHCRWGNIWNLEIHKRKGRRTLLCNDRKKSYNKKHLCNGFLLLHTQVKKCWVGKSWQVDAVNGRSGREKHKMQLPDGDIPTSCDRQLYLMLLIGDPLRLLYWMSGKWRLRQVIAINGSIGRSHAPYSVLIAWCCWC